MQTGKIVSPFSIFFFVLAQNLFMNEPIIPPTDGGSDKQNILSGLSITHVFLCMALMGVDVSDDRIKAETSI